MAQDPRGEVFHAAGAYHAALARYVHALSERGDIEGAAQELLGRSLFYRSALENMADSAMRRRRLRCLKVLLNGASRQYMAVAKRARGAV